MDVENVLSVKGISYLYAPELPFALHDVNIDLPTGARCLFIGQNGSGKSTLLELVRGLHRPCAGEATVFNKDCFTDTTLNAIVGLIGGPWPKNASCLATVEELVAGWSGVDPQRFKDLCWALSVDPQWRVERCSSGMVRKIQILLGLILPRRVLCLDEFSTDLDIVERERVLNFLTAQSIENQTTILYATHIFDGLSGWPTHIALMAKATVHRVLPATPALRQLAYEWVSSTNGAALPVPPPFQSLRLASSEPFIRISGLNVSLGRKDQGKFSHSKLVFQDAAVEVPRGARCLVIGANGSGKTTLLRHIAGKHWIPKKVIRIGDRDAFHDSKLNDTIGYSGDWWDAIPWLLSLEEMLDGAVMDERALALQKVLDVDLKWLIGRVSCGQQRRMQLFHSLLKFKPLLLLDEVTAELDVVQRQRLVEYLYEESVQRGCTVLNATHIFEGLEGWATHLLIVDADYGLKCVEVAGQSPEQTLALIHDTILQIKSSTK